MKIFERILNNHVHHLIQITVNQAGFIKDYGTTDAMHTAGLLIEKNRKRQRRIYIAFIDLEKAFDGTSIKQRRLYVHMKNSTEVSPDSNRKIRIKLTKSNVA